MTDVVRAAYLTIKSPRKRQTIGRVVSCAAVVAVCIGTVAVSPRPSGASSIGSAREEANSLLAKINSVTAKVDRLGQAYDAKQIALNKIRNEIDTTASVVASIKQNVSKGNAQLQSDAIFAYVTNGSSTGNNPLFTANASKVGAANIYGQLAEGNIGSTIANLRNYRIRLTHEQGLLRYEQSQAGPPPARPARHCIRPVVRSDAALGPQPGEGPNRHLYPTSPGRRGPTQRGDIANRVAKHQRVQLVPSSAARFTCESGDPRGDDLHRRLVSMGWCQPRRSGLFGPLMLAYDAAGIYLPHYSGAQYPTPCACPSTRSNPGTSCSTARVATNTWRCTWATAT